MKTKNVKLTAGKLKPERLNTLNGKYFLRLYIAGQTANAVNALRNLKAICNDKLKGKYFIEVIDLLKNPKPGCDDQVLAIPTLIRKFPVPARRIIGDLSNSVRVLAWLDLKGQSI